MTETPILARFPGRCCACGGEIHRGDYIVKTAPRKWAHAETCPEQPPPRLALQRAISEVESARQAIPAPYRPDPAPLDGLYGEVREAERTRDPARALRAVAAFKGHWLSTFSRALLHAPLEEAEPTTKGAK